MEMLLDFEKQLEKYSSKPLREAIFHIVKNAILEGVFLPGDRITEDDLAQKFNCSRTPVREALRKLEQDNLLKVKPGIGMEISSIDIGLLEQEFEIRKILESYAIEKACEKITDDQFKNLEWLTDKIENSLKINDYIAASYANTEFHQLLYSISGNHFLKKITEMLWISMRLSFLAVRQNTNIFDYQWYQDRVNEHRQLIEALKDKDKGKAVAINIAHVDQNYHYCVAVLKQGFK